MTASLATASDVFRELMQHAAARVIEQASISFGSMEGLCGQFPFVENYGGIAKVQLQDHEALRRLQSAADLTISAMELWLAIGLIEEDARFGPLFESVHEIHGQHRPTVSLLTAWWRDTNDCANVRRDLRLLLELGLVEAVNPDAPRLEWALQVPAVLWDALRGDPLSGNVFTHAAAEENPQFEDLLLDDSIHERWRELRALFTVDGAALVVRGPHHNGRRALLGALARSHRMGTLQFREGSALKLAGPLATLLQAMPVLVLDAGPGESLEISRLRAYRGAMGIAMGRFGQVHGSACEPLTIVNMAMPSEERRRALWQRAAPGVNAQAAGVYRLTSGNIIRAARLAHLSAAAAWRESVEAGDVRMAASSLSRQSLDTLAVRMETTGGWSRIAVDYETAQELRNLESRCRYRERLAQELGDAFRGSSSHAVRALFKGPSGCGKTYAAGLLASALGKDIYRVDLSSVVNKYIGETEKNLDRLFSLTEELDVILLLDEGDALLTQRTAVQSSNDRYANLETNFLLQRIEAFDGILIVTTNASDRIDPAFQRRMDVVIGFQAPEGAERHAIWQLHLPLNHQVDARFLVDAAARCSLSGGQIRNAVLHASLLALEQGSAIHTGHLDSAIRREYRKAGGDCPLRR